MKARKDMVRMGTKVGAAFGAIGFCSGTDSGVLFWQLRNAGLIKSSLRRAT